MIKKIEVDNIQIACWLNPAGFGEHRQSLIFIHGSGGDHTGWSYQYSRLYKQYNIVAVDLPGHGASTGGGEKDIDQYCFWIKKLLDVLQPGNPVLVGHSLGAAVVMKFALHYPQDVAGIVPVGGGLKMPVNPDWFRGLKTDPARAVNMICQLSLAEENSSKLLEALKKSLSKTSLDVLCDDLCACNSLDLTADIGKINLRTLVLCGEEDKMMPVRFSREIATGINGAELSLIKSAGHMVMLERPAEFNAALSKFASSGS